MRHNSSFKAKLRLLGIPGNGCFVLLWEKDLFVGH